MKKTMLIAAAVLALPSVAVAAGASGGATPGNLAVQLSGLRSGKGTVYVCLSASPQHFLRCQDDKASVSRSIAAGQAGQRFDLGPIKPGTYALLVVHDENRNGKLDMMLGIPREGFGFSNNPTMRPRPPRWEEIRFTVPAGASAQAVRVRYVL